MSKLTALKAAAQNGYNPNQARDSTGKWTSGGGMQQLKAIAGQVATKGAIAGAGAIGHHLGGEAGAMVAMIGTRAAISLGHKALTGQLKEHDDATEAALDRCEELAMGDVFGHVVSGAVNAVVGAAADSVLPHGGTAIGAAASAAITPHLVKAARRLKAKRGGSLAPQLA